MSQPQEIHTLIRRVWQCFQYYLFTRESMCLQTMFAFFGGGWSENIDHVMQNASNFCHSCQDIKINSVPTFHSLKSDILYFSVIFKWFLFCFIPSCPVLYFIKKSQSLWGSRIYIYISLKNIACL